MLEIKVGEKPKALKCLVRDTKLLVLLDLGRSRLDRWPRGAKRHGTILHFHLKQWSVLQILSAC